MRQPRPSPRRGFSLTEVALAGFMMSVLALLLGNAWASFGRPAISSVARIRVAQEANLAAEALARDVGYLAQPTGNQSDTRYQNVQGGGPILYLSIDDGTGSPRSISYAPDPNDSTRLLRTDLSAAPGSGRVVATLLADFQAQSATLSGAGSGGTDVTGVQIDMTFTHRTYDRDLDGSFRADHTRRYSLFVPDPRP
jgi:hypothetical protein